MNQLVVHLVHLARGNPPFLGAARLARGLRREWRVKTRADALLYDPVVSPTRPASSPGRATPTQRHAARLDEPTRRAQDTILDAAWTAPVQLARDSHTGLDDAEIQAAAAHGVADGGGALPHLDAIQRSFGAHDVTSISAHVGGAARDASHAIGAHAYATGNHVAFAETPDLFLAAHEAAHVVQQRSGVQLSSAVGQAGDAYEQHADAVAARVVAGESAADLLDAFGGHAENGGVQRKAAPDLGFGHAPVEANALGIIRVAAGRAEAALEDLEAKRITPDEACAGLVEPTREARIALFQARTYHETQRPLIPDFEGNLAYEAIKPTAYQLFASLLRLMQVATGLARSTGATALELVAGSFKAEAELAKMPMTGSIADLADKGGAGACPPGAAESGKKGCWMKNEKRTVRGQAENRLLGFLHRAEQAFLAECENQKEAVEAEIAADSALLGALLGIVVGPVLGALTRNFVNAWGGTDEIAAKVTELAKPGTVKRLAAAVTPDGGRAGALGAIEALRRGAEQMVSVTQSTLIQLDDDQLVLLSTELEFTDPEAVRQHVADHVARYRAQIEPLGQRDQLRDSSDYADNPLRGQLARFRPAWIHHDGKRRLARVSQVKPAKLAEDAGNLLGRITGHTIRHDRFYFECWIDEEFTQAALAWSPSDAIDTAYASAITLSPDDLEGFGPARARAGLREKS